MHVTFANVRRALWPYTVSAAVYCAAQWGLTVAVNSIATNGRGSLSIVWVFNVGAYSLLVLAGFIVGILSRRYLISRGILAGMVCALLSIGIFGVAYSDFLGGLIHVANGAILGGAGGFIVRLARRRIGKPRSFD